MEVLETVINRRGDRRIERDAIKEKQEKALQYLNRRLPTC